MKEVPPQESMSNGGLPAFQDVSSVKAARTDGASNLTKSTQKFCPN